MTVTTAGKIGESAMRKLGLLAGNKKPNGNDTAFLLTALNTLVDALQLEPGYAYRVAETVRTISSADSVLTLGPGGQLDMQRPVGICDSSFVRVAGIDHRLEILDQRGWNGISKKTLGGSWPVACYFDNAQPLGFLNLFPQGSGELHLFSTMNPVSAFANAVTLYQLPQGWERFLAYMLAVEVAPDFETVPSQQVKDTAKGCSRMLQISNLTIPRLKIPNMGNAPSWYTEADFISGQ